MKIKINQGQHVFYRNNKYIDDIEFVVLNSLVDIDSIDNNLNHIIVRCSCYCISANLLKEQMPFDINNHNDWNTSSLKKYLNEEYIKRFSKEDLVQSDGDLITLLSKEEVERYEDILPEYSTFWWTRSAYFYSAYYAWFVNPSGQLNDSGLAAFAHGVIPACIFNLNNLTISQEENNIIFESKN